MRVESIPSAGRATPGPWIRAVTLGSVIAMAAGLQAGAATADQAGSTVSVYMSSANLDSTLVRGPELAFGGSVASVGERIDVDATVTGQTLTAGFGVAMTESSAYLLRNQLPASLREDVIRALFSPSEGIGLSFLRIPIGASDYVVGDLATPESRTSR